jgi:hypothetical protein
MRQLAFIVRYDHTLAIEYKGRFIPDFTQNFFSDRRSRRTIDLAALLALLGCAEKPPEQRRCLLPWLGEDAATSGQVAFETLDLSSSRSFDDAPSYYDKRSFIDRKKHSCAYRFTSESPILPLIVTLFLVVCSYHPFRTIERMFFLCLIRREFAEGGRRCRRLNSLSA